MLGLWASLPSARIVDGIQEDGLHTYMVERYLPGSTGENFARDVDRAGEAAEQATTDGAVRYLRSTLVPQDEMCFHLFEASSAQALARALERAGISYERISEAMDVPVAEGLRARERRLTDPVEQARDK